MMIVVYDSSLNLLNKKMMQSGFYFLGMINIQVFNGYVYYYMQGQISTGDATTTVIMGSDDQLSFATLGCFEINTFPMPGDTLLVSTGNTPMVPTVTDLTAAGN